MSANIEGLSWLGREPVPETVTAGKVLLSAWARLIDFPLLLPDPDFGGTEWVKWVCLHAGAMQQITDKLLDGWDDGLRIWVGFPETPIGRMNAQLAAVVAKVNRWKTRACGFEDKE